MRAVAHANKIGVERWVGVQLDAGRDINDIKGREYRKLLQNAELQQKFNKKAVCFRKHEP